MSADVTRVTRRLFGLPREVWAIRCPYCKWRTEVREMSIAVELVRRHICKETA